jgi:hypothetical protein
MNKITFTGLKSVYCDVTRNKQNSEIKRETDRELWNLKKSRHVFPSIIFTSERANRFCEPIKVHMFEKIKVDSQFICFLLSLQRKGEEVAKDRVKLTAIL